MCHPSGKGLALSAGVVQVVCVCVYVCVQVCVPTPFEKMDGVLKQVKNAIKREC